MSRAATPQVSFADLEFMQQGIFLDSVLQTISYFLDQHGEMIEKVRSDLERGLKNPATGRNGMTPSQVLRSLVLMRVKSWDLRELSERIADGYTLRHFTETLQAVNELIVQAAVDLGLEDGKKLRVDSTVVQTDVHHPTDSTLLWDTVRVITRLVGRLGRAAGRSVLKGFRHRTRGARRRMQQIQRMTAQQRHKQQNKKYRELIAITEEVEASARGVLQQSEKARGQNLIDDLAIRQLRNEIDRYCQLGTQAIDQARRRVLEGEQVPNAEKIFSIFEPHTDLIKRGKVQTPVEFGHKVFLAESAQGLITQYQVLDGNPCDEDQVEASLKNHRETFGSAPDLYGSDRGFYSENNVKRCEQEGVKVVSIPQRGGKKTPEREAFEKSPAFKKGQRFRAGVEGRISVLFRGRGMKRCLAQGRTRFELLVGAAVLANNLMRIAALMIKSSSRKRPTA